MLPLLEQPISVYAPSRLVRARPHFWLWPNLLSLDAPLVAVLWHSLFVRCFHLDSDWHITAALGLAVWFIYVMDRLLDTLASSGEGVTARHIFCYQQWNRFAIGLFAALLSLCWICGRLPARVLESGFCLLGAVLLYFAVVHGNPVHRRLIWSKEVTVGIIFALGTSLAAWTSVSARLRPRTVLPIAMFAALCSLNCIAIDYWESHFRATAELGSYFVGISASVVAVSALALILAGASLRPFFFSSLLSALTLIYFWTQSGRFAVESLRVLADAALLSPIIAWLLC